MHVEVDGVTRQGIFDTGATDSIYASRLVKSPDYNHFCAIKVGNGNYEYSERETTVHVDLGTFKLPHECVCLNTTAFDVCIGMNFVRLELRCNPEVDLYANTVNAVEGSIVR